MEEMFGICRRTGAVIVLSFETLFEISRFLFVKTGWVGVVGAQDHLQ